MTITKFGHSCVLLDDGQAKLLFDPGNWTQVPELNVDAVVITHAHADHMDMSNIRALLKSNSELHIITNTEVKEQLDKEGINCEVIEDGQTTEVKSFKLEAFGNQHAVIHPSMPTAQNTCYLVNEKIYHPGDALHVPPKPVEVLFLPVVAPWSKISETLDYIDQMKPKICIPIHDAILTEEARTGLFYRLSGGWLEKVGAQFIKPVLGTPYEINT